jgi:ribosomal protein S13
MARIAGVDLPREKRVEVALTYIYGIGRPTSARILNETGVNLDTRVRDLSDAEVARLRQIIEPSSYRPPHTYRPCAGVTAYALGTPSSDAKTASSCHFGAHIHATSPRGPTRQPRSPSASRAYSRRTCGGKREESR